MFSSTQAGTAGHRSPRLQACVWRGGSDRTHQGGQDLIWRLSHDSRHDNHWMSH